MAHRYVEPSKPATSKPRSKPQPPVDHVAESVRSILALLRGMGPVLVSSSPNQTETIELLANLKDPTLPKEG